jgi:hypothetical protein
MLKLRKLVKTISSWELVHSFDYYAQNKNTKENKCQCFCTDVNERPFDIHRLPFGVMHGRYNAFLSKGARLGGALYYV